MDHPYERLPLIFNAADYFVAGNIRAGRADKIAFFYQDRTMTYGEVLGGVQRAASLVQQNGVEREQRVALLLPDSPDLVLSFWGAIWAGCVPVLLHIASTPEDLYYSIADARARLLITTTSLHKSIIHKSIGLRHLRSTILVDDEPRFDDRLAGVPPLEEAAETHRDEPAFWLYTSGTTGRPKGVMHAQHHMVTCAENYGVGVVGLSADDLCYSVAKISFAYGLGNLLYMPMAVGAAAVLSSSSNAFDIVADVEYYRPTVFWGIPSIYANLLAVHDIAPLDTSSIRLFLSAAEQLPESIWHAFRDLYGHEICEGIGTTEMLHIFLSNRPGEGKPGCSGRPVPG